MMSLTHSILAQHAGKENIFPGEILTLDIDLILGSDVSTPLAIQALESIGSPILAHPERIVLVPDHCNPPSTSAHQTNIQNLYAFSEKQGITHAMGKENTAEIGVEHALLPEQGFIQPYQVIMGADSHTCTYGAFGTFATGIGSTDLAAAMVLSKTWFQVPPMLFLYYTGTIPSWITGKDIILHTLGKLGTDGALGQAVEFYGPIIDALPMEERITICNMAVEMAAVSGIIMPDNTTYAWLANKGIDIKNISQPLFQCPEISQASYVFDITSLSPQVACPSSPGNVQDIEKVTGTKLNQVFIGSCTNGSLHDLRQAASLLKNQKIAQGLRLYIAPATPTIYKNAQEEGILEIFLSAGAQLLPPTCGVCFGHLGCLAANEVCLSTSNRNFKGRMGHAEAKIYLASPYVAAASALTGYICHPEKI